MPAHKGGKKNRKHGRNKASCLSYKNSHRRERNKLRRLRHHLLKFPDDGVALLAVKKLV